MAHNCTEEEVLAALRKDISDPTGMHVHPCRPKDRAIYFSNVYEVWNLVYRNVVHTVVRGFKVCRMCELFIVIDQGRNGNSKLTRHTCFKEYLKNGTSLQQQNSEDEVITSKSSTTLSQDQVRILSYTFSALSTKTSDEVQQILPRNWELHNW